MLSKDGTKWSSGQILLRHQRNASFTHEMCQKFSVGYFSSTWIATLATIGKKKKLILVQSANIFEICLKKVDSFFLHTHGASHNPKDKCDKNSIAH